DFGDESRPFGFGQKRSVKTTSGNGRELTDAAAKRCGICVFVGNARFEERRVVRVERDRDARVEKLAQRVRFVFGEGSGNSIARRARVDGYSAIAQEGKHGRVAARGDAVTDPLGAQE